MKMKSDDGSETHTVQNMLAYCHAYSPHKLVLNLLLIRCAVRWGSPERLRSSPSHWPGAGPGKH
jgi:hypothetical protein